MTDHLCLAPRSILDVVAVGGLSIDMKPGIIMATSQRLSRGFHRLALAASTAAIGFAQVARIKSTTPGSGGSRPSLGGGSAAKASTQTGGTAASSGPSQSVFINVQGKSRFTVDEVNDLMEQLIERQRDGAQLVLVRWQMRQQGQSDAEILAALDRLERTHRTGGEFLPLDATS